MLREKKVVWLLALAGLAVLTAGCPDNGDLDDGDSAPVVFEVAVLNRPPASTQPGGSPPSCANPVVTVQPWDAQARNEPKNANAITSPFNDIELTDVTITYSCDGGVACPPVWVQGLTGTIPADGALPFQFDPIRLQDIDSTLVGQTVDLSMVFRAKAVSGQDITYLSGAALAIESCIGVTPPPP